jgi:cyclopropane-fatty-acyl-phospholipid synthase
MGKNGLERLFFGICEKIENGALTVIMPTGEVHRFGAGAPEAEIVVHDWSWVSLALARGDVGLGEGYVQGLWDSPDVEALLTVFLHNEHISVDSSGGAFVYRLFFRLLNSWLRRNNRSGSAKNIHAHYDVGNEFYELWLDPTMTYSSALFDGKGSSLESAQERKYERMLSLLPKNAERILEIGCGWGGFAEQAAKYGRTVTGVTVSPAQFDYATKRLGSKADIRLQDYRDIDGKFDSIVSIEMIEAVGEAYWPQYFRKLKECLADGGRAALQVITVADESFDHYRRQSDFIRHYTFPGGMLVPPKKIREMAEKAGLAVKDFHAFGKDYAVTLRQWKERFDNAERKIRALGHGDSFLRSWRYYFDFCAAGFNHGKHIDVAQVSLSHA